MDITGIVYSSKAKGESSFTLNSPDGMGFVGSQQRPDNTPDPANSYFGSNSINPTKTRISPNEQLNRSQLPDRVKITDDLIKGKSTRDISDSEITTDESIPVPRSKIPGKMDLNGGKSAPTYHAGSKYPDLVSLEKRKTSSFTTHYHIPGQVHGSPQSQNTRSSDIGINTWGNYSQSNKGNSDSYPENYWHDEFIKAKHEFDNKNKMRDFDSDDQKSDSYKDSAKISKVVENKNIINNIQRRSQTENNFFDKTEKRMSVKQNGDGNKQKSEVRTIVKDRVVIKHDKSDIKKHEPQNKESKKENKTDKPESSFVFDIIGWIFGQDVIVRFVIALIAGILGFGFIFSQLGLTNLFDTITP